MEIGDEKIDTTANHPFWVEDYGFKPSGLLEVGDLVETADGKLLPVTGRDKIAELAWQTRKFAIDNGF